MTVGPARGDAGVLAGGVLAGGALAGERAGWAAFEAAGELTDAGLASGAGNTPEPDTTSAAGEAPAGGATGADAGAPAGSCAAAGPPKPRTAAAKPATTLDQLNAVALALSSALIDRHKDDVVEPCADTLARARLFADPRAQGVLYAMVTSAPRTNVRLRFEDF